LAQDTENTVAEAKRLFTQLKRPNIMIKVPATSAGLPAITELIGSGINVNVTLFFSVTPYQEVAGKYLSERIFCPPWGKKIFEICRRQS